MKTFGIVSTPVKWALRWGQRWPPVDLAAYGPHKAEVHRRPLAPKLRALKTPAQSSKP